MIFGREDQYSFCVAYWLRVKTNWTGGELAYLHDFHRNSAPAERARSAVEFLRHETALGLFHGNHGRLTVRTLTPLE